MINDFLLIYLSGGFFALAFLFVMYIRDRRRLSLEDANSVIQRCPLNKVVEWCGETGHNLVVWPDGYAAKMKKTISGYVVICCKKVN